MLCGAALPLRGATPKSPPFQTITWLFASPYPEMADVVWRFENILQVGVHHLSRCRISATAAVTPAIEVTTIWM
jgi:hypothetical protein